MFLLIDNYDSFTYNLRALFRECGADVTVVKNDAYVPADDAEGIIISPGPSSPDRSGTTLRYLAEYLGVIPVFGVCLGMQAIAHTLGYPVVRARTVQHGKVDTVLVVGPSLLFRGLPSSFSAVRYHSLAAAIDNELVTSRSAGDGTVMSIENPSGKFFGVQFHPESVLSEHGAAIINNFLQYAREDRARRTEVRHDKPCEED